ncbi:Leucine dehydrogenase [Geodia barretti]|uniref:Leucine dehydrogenase n=1 Tax=Geodia barretti TaxID=519541 RepID=A0AA35R5I6_GEOBA|nr:Leucine dehydrogenase [Geodia barretti]
MNILEHMNAEGHEQVAMFSDPASGLKAIIAVHDTTLGPACGGTRMWPYESEAEALTDALRLSQAMTYKSAAAGLHFGGGKGVIIGDPHKVKSEALMRAYGRSVDTLGGRYLTTTDVGTTARDLEFMRQETRHVTGLPVSLGGSGDTSIMTGLGLYMGMKACAEEVWGNGGLRGKTVAVQGFGKVASHLCEHLMEEDTRIVVTDVFEDALDRARDWGLEVTSPNSIMTTDCDIFAPCALGGVLNSQTIPQLKCRVVAGGANNQLLSDDDGEELHRRGILYAPDYIINAGGIINVEAEMGDAGYSPERAREKTERIHEIMGSVIRTSQAEEISTAVAAAHLAEERLDSVRRIRSMRRSCQ